MATLCHVLFLLIPPLLLALHTWRSTAPLWLLWLIFAPIGWGLVNAGNYFYYGELQHLIDSTPQPGEELLRAYANDAGRPITLLFGWTYGLIYFGALIVVYAFVRRAREEKS